LDTLGKHLLVEYHGCDHSVLSSVARIEAMMRAAARAAGATVVAAAFHRFSPQGVSGVVVVEESHLSIHTWPECGYAAVDIYTCGECEPLRAHDFLREELDADRAEVMNIRRGMYPPGRSMGLVAHYKEADRDDDDDDTDDADDGDGDDRGLAS
jgi:S-adenosylmethionine decarboxylase proenzyme